MFCSKCGNVIADKLNYCNVCGGKLTAESNNSLNVILMSLIISFALISIVGLISLIAFLSILFDKGVQSSTISMIAGSFLLAIFGITYIIGKQISKIIDGKLGRNNQNPETVFQPQLTAPVTGQLQEARIRPASVTENTTKTLDEVLLKR